MRLPLILGSKVATIVVAGVVVAAGVGTVAALGPSSTTTGTGVSVGAHIVVGFGDSVAAGYGLSRAAEWPVSRISRRFPGGDATCPATTPRAYPCLLAASIGDLVAASRNYSVQNASSSDVLTQLDWATRDMPAQARERVDVVTLTVGADDINFADCLTAEIQFERDPCLAGDINNLKASDATRTQLSNLSTTLTQPAGPAQPTTEPQSPAVLSSLAQAYPNAHILVTGYYDPFPDPVQAGRSACRLFVFPALAAFMSNLDGVGLLGKASAFNNYAGSLPNTESLFQTRFHRVSSFLASQLNDTLSAAVGNSGGRATFVSLDSFEGHDMCAADPWVYSLTSHGGIKGLGDIRALGADCPFPLPYDDSEPSETKLSFDLGPLGSVVILSNCVPHPTPLGQAQIAAAIIQTQVADPSGSTNPPGPTRPPQVTVLKTFEPWVATGPSSGAPAPGLSVADGGAAACDGGSSDDPGSPLAVRCSPPGNGTPCFIDDTGGGDPGAPVLCSSDPTSNQLIMVRPDNSNGIPTDQLNHENVTAPAWFLVLADGRQCRFLGYGTNTSVLSYDCGGDIGATLPDRSQPTWTVQEGALKNGAKPSSVRVAVITAYR